MPLVRHSLLGARLQRGSAPGQLLEAQTCESLFRFWHCECIKQIKYLCRLEALGRHEKESYGITHPKISYQFICTPKSVQYSKALDLIFPMSSRTSHCQPPSDRKRSRSPPRTSGSGSRSRKISTVGRNVDIDVPMVDSHCDLKEMSILPTDTPGTVHDTLLRGLDAKVDAIGAQLESMAKITKNTQIETVMPARVVSYLDWVGPLLPTMWSPK